METRSRKRGEATSQRPSSANANTKSTDTSAVKTKRARLDHSNSASASASSSPPAPRRSARAAAAARAAMDAADRAALAGDLTKEEEIQKKGKQKESEESNQTHKEEERDEIVSSEYDEEEEEYEDEFEDEYAEDGGGRPPELQGMLRRLAIYGFPARAEEAERLKNILSSLREDGDDYSQIEALTELCEILPFASEDMRERVSIDSFVPILVGMLNKEGNADVMLLAARALTHICEVFPSSCASVVHHGAIPCFCARLLTINYIDLAEQSLQALEKISHRHASACLRSGALMAVLSFLDFFSTGVRRVALSTAANISKQLSPDTIDSAIEAIPTLTSLLSDSDSKLVEHASVCLARITEAAAASPEKLEKLSSYGLVSQVATLISPSNSSSVQASLSSPTFMAVIGLLSACARGSAVLSRELLEMGISGIIRDIVAGSGLISQMPTLSLNRPLDQLSEIVSFVNDLLPSLPHETITLPTAHYIGSTRKLTSRNGTQNSDQEKFLLDKPELLAQFGIDLFPTMIQVYGSSVNIQARHKCLSIISKVLYFSTPDMLNTLLQTTNISSFLAGILIGKDNEVVLPALQMAEILMQKLPEMFFKMFMKEGVFHAVDKLISSGSSTSGKDKSFGTETSLKTRRNRKVMEDIKDSTVRKASSSAVASNAKTDFKEIISTQAMHFKDTYFSANLGATGVTSTDSLCKLTNLCRKLNGSLCDLKGKSKGKGKKIKVEAINNNYQLPHITNILSELGKDDGVSTFEFVNSGVVASLLNYFTGGTSCKENISQSELMKHRQQLFKRLQAFVDVSLPLNYKGIEAPLTTLVRKLQDALSSLEQFPVVLSQGPRHTDSILAGANALKRPLQLQFRRAQGEKYLREYSSNVISMDPLANITDIEDFLWSKVQRNETGTNSTSGAAEPSANACMPSQLTCTPCFQESRPSTRSRSSTAMGSVSANTKDSANSKSSKEKGKSVSTVDSEGPQTRSAVRRRAALKKVLRLKQHEESSDEDEDPYAAPVELEQAVPMDEGGNSEDVDDEDDGEDEGMFVEEPATVCVVERVNGLELRDLMDTSARASTSGTPDVVRRKISNSSRGASGNRDSHRLSFYIGGEMLDRSSTLYQSIRDHVIAEGDQRYSRLDVLRSGSHNFWDEVYTITFQRAEAPAKRDLAEMPKTCSTPNVLLIDNILRRKLPCNLNKSDITHDILLLLRVIEELNQLAPRLRAQSSSDGFAEGKLKNLDDLKVGGPLVPRDEFLNVKLTPKLARQLQDAVILCGGSLPTWCHQLTKVCPFLFPFETRRQYFYSTALGVHRALHRLQQQQISQNPNLANNRGRHAGRLPRQKVRVSRKRILESAAKVMELCSGQKAVLEVEYYNEVGTGLGPTLEFYTLISHEMQKTTHGMWRTSFSSSGAVDTVQTGEFVQSSFGLFPRPYLPTYSAIGSKFIKVRENFSLLGSVMAKALQDGRLLDLPLSTAFYKLVLGKELDLYDIKSFDLELGTTMQEMQALVHRKQYLESMSGDRRDEIAHLQYRGVKIEDLCIDFTLPGFLDYPLKPDGSNILVDIYNLDEYVSLVVDATIKTGIMSQIEAFRSGFNQVISISTLQIFTENEMDTLVCGVSDLWMAETLTDHIKFDHGYTAQSTPVLHFLEIIAKFTPLQQRAFLQFITGCPRLPPGGLGALNPKLTVVRKNSSGHTDTNLQETVDVDLPSVMTCANYLKLPPYSSKEIMCDRLLYAITEGQGSFDLS